MFSFFRAGGAWPSFLELMLLRMDGKQITYNFSSRSLFVEPLSHSFEWVRVLVFSGVLVWTNKCFISFQKKKKTESNLFTTNKTEQRCQDADDYLVLFPPLPLSFSCTPLYIILYVLCSVLCVQWDRRWHNFSTLCEIPEMAVSVNKVDGVTVYTMASDPRNPYPPLCQILFGFCCNPLCCAVSGTLRKIQGGSQYILGVSGTFVSYKHSISPRHGKKEVLSGQYW